MYPNNLHRVNLYDANLIQVLSAGVKKSWWTRIEFYVFSAILMQDAVEIRTQKDEISQSGSWQVIRGENGIRELISC